MDTIQLRLFASIANTRNFSKTAEQFFITQPAVSHHMKMLENALGAQLINRANRKISLTEEGLEFLPYANKILELSSNAEIRIQNMAEGRKRYFRVAAISSASHLLSDCLVKLYEQYPSVHVDIDLLEGTELINSLQDGSGNYDFCFTIKDMISNSKEYEHRDVARDRLMLFVNKGIEHTIDMNDWSTIEKHPFVSVPKSDTWLSSQIMALCKNRGITPHIINFYNRAESVVLSVNAGIGVAILSGELRRLYQRPNVVTLPIEGEDADFKYVFAWRKEKKTPACTAFKEIALNTLVPHSNEYNVKD